MIKLEVTSLLESVLKEKPSLFLIDLKVSIDNKIKIIIDSDKKVSLDDCIYINKFIESKLDREKYDYSLEVSSAGMSNPLVLPRQFKKHLNKEFKVQEKEGNTYKGKLIHSDDEHFILEWNEKKKKESKVKNGVPITKKFLYTEVINPKIILKF